MRARAELTRIHLDTDLGGAPDDACALAMLLGWEGVEIMGITTTIDPDGRRATYVRYLLARAGRSDIPVEAGAQVSMTTGERADPVIDDERFWPRDLEPAPSTPGAAASLLKASIEAGATLVGIGPATNLALLEQEEAGAPARAPVVVMGGWTEAPAPGLPKWGPEMDWNIQWDTKAARILGSAANQLTLTTLPATLKTHLRRAHLSRLRASGPLGKLLARQAEAHAVRHGMLDLIPANSALPEDFLNFHYDPVTCAVAAGWGGATVEEMRLVPVLEDDVLCFRPNEGGRTVRCRRRGW